MKKTFLIFAATLVSLNNCYSQTRVSFYAGYGFSQYDDTIFEGESISQTGYFPAGVNIEFGTGMFTFGVEANYSVMPFNFDFERESLGKIEITQLIAGGFVKVRFRNRREINPYIRAGVGYYGGKAKQTYTEEFKQTNAGAEDSEYDFSAAIGVNGGIGMDFPISHTSYFYFEGIYHFIKRKYDLPDAKSFQANNIAFFLGYTHIF
jgi:opacity protein-like surface antigen